MRSHALRFRSRRPYQEAREGKAIASGPSSSSPHRNVVGMSRTAEDIPTAIIVDLSLLDISSLRYPEKLREIPLLICASSNRP